MFEINDYVVNGSLGVCQIIDIVKDRNMRGEEIEFYALRPVFSNSNNMMTIKTPVNNPKVAMRDIVTKEDVADLLELMSGTETVWIDDAMKRGENFKLSLKTGEIEEIFKIVKTLHSEKREYTAIGKNLSRTDEEMLKTAEKQLVEEFSLVLDISPDEVIPYIQNQLTALKA